MKLLCLLILIPILLNMSCATQEKRQTSDSIIEPVQVWENSNIFNVSIKQLNSSNRDTVRVPLTIIRNRLSGWTSQEILFLINETENIFSQCKGFGIGISISPISYVELNHNKLNSLHYRNDFLFAKDLPRDIRKPVAIFTETNSFTKGGYANRAEVLKDNRKKDSYGTVFIVRSIREYLKEYPYIYKSIIAHEILHILLEENPNDLPGNIMNHDEKSGGIQLTKDQCEKVVSHPFVKK